MCVCVIVGLCSALLELRVFLYNLLNGIFQIQFLICCHVCSGKRRNIVHGILGHTLFITGKLYLKPCDLFLVRVRLLRRSLVISGIVPAVGIRITLILFLLALPLPALPGKPLLHSCFHVGFGVLWLVSIISGTVIGVIAALIVIGLWFAPGPMINGFNKFGTGVTVVITVLTAIAVFQQITGIMFPVFDVMSTVDPDLGMTPLNNGLLVCGQIGIVLIGAFPMVEWITRTFGGALSKLGGALGMNDKGSAGLVATLANNIAMFNIMGEMNPKGKILNVAFAVSAAFVFGDHLGFAAGNDAQMIFPMIAGKLVAGVTALIVANLLAPKLLSKIQTISK